MAQVAVNLQAKPFNLDV